jgi:hypothetical protein
MQALTSTQIAEFDKCAEHIYIHVMMLDIEHIHAGDWFHADPVFISGEFSAGIHQLEAQPEVLYVQVARQLGYWPAACCQLDKTEFEDTELESTH